MSRRIVTTAPESLAGESLDTFSGRVVKYIPADIVAAWITVSSLMASPPSSSSQTGASTSTVAASNYTTLWVVFVVFLILTIFWVWRTTHEPGAPVARTQILISTISFAVWVFGIGGPFASIDFIRQRPFLGGVVLIIWTLIAGLIVPPEPDKSQNVGAR
jgi:hypothetical protein